MSACIVASCTPCDRSATSSLWGRRVAVMRRRSSSRSSCGTATWNGRMAAEVVLALVMEFPSFVWLTGGCACRHDADPPTGSPCHEHTRTKWRLPCKIVQSLLFQQWAALLRPYKIVQGGVMEEAWRLLVIPASLGIVTAR